MPDKITKFIESLDQKTRERLRKKLLALKKDPFGMHDVKKMKDAGENVYRMRLGKIRIISKLLGKDIKIIDIDYRGNIY